MKFLTEDQVRDGYAPADGGAFVSGARQILEFDKSENDVEQGTGQITTFQQLGFNGDSKDHKPDGWYLPNDLGKVAIVLETKNSDEKLSKKKWENELLFNIRVLMKKYSKVIGILYNGINIRVFKNTAEITQNVSPQLQNKLYYIKLFTDEKIDKIHIYEVTKRINDSLHFKFGMQDLQDRMIFTACALVAQRYNPQNGLQDLKGKSYSTFHNWIYSALSKAIEKDKRQNDKINILLEEFAAVRMSITEDQEAIDNFIDNVCDIAELVNSDHWNGEDVMAIFFNEFNRYHKKAEAGQVFTPDHVTSFMYRLIGVSKDDRILDATCGSGAFLVKAMCNMIKEAGGVNSKDVPVIRSERLFGIEMYRKIFALACANMMIHKDGKTNLVQMDAKTFEAGRWIASKNITKVLMNPPFERKYKCMEIVENVLNSVPENTLCAFILPDKKLEKDYIDKDFEYKNKLLKKHTLTTIVKMPENLFLDKGITTSVFVFLTGKPQNGRNIIGYYIEDDGLVTVKNQGRQDIKNKWAELEDYWIQAIQDGNDDRYHTRQIIHPAEHLSYQMPKKPFEIYEEDFIKTIMDYQMFQQNIDTRDFENKLLREVMYSSEIRTDQNTGELCIILKRGNNHETN